jgi:hypothetical protein
VRKQAVPEKPRAWRRTDRNSTARQMVLHTAALQKAAEGSDRSPRRLAATGPKQLMRSKWNITCRDRTGKVLDASKIGSKCIALDVALVGNMCISDNKQLFSIAESIRADSA